MQNYVQPGDVVALTAPYTVTSGQGAKVGSIFGVAETDILINVEGQFRVVGVFDLTKATGLDFAQGDRVYWDNVQRKCVDTDSGNSYSIGVALTAASTSATTVRVRLNDSYTS